MKRLQAACIALLVLWLLASAAQAETRRLAIVVGNNAGSLSQKPLRYAETDAGKFARVLVELGGVREPDLFLLQGARLAELEDVIGRVQRRTKQLHAQPATRVVLLFYFSGHSDGVSLELGEDKLSYRRLRERLEGSQADVRLLIVDSCKSGALVSSKGGSLGPSFEIAMQDDLATTGEITLTSSAADELALESADIRASFFSHHLTTGLRGAADKSGDGLVTLEEAYQYSYARTVLDSDSTLQGRQHPHYEYRLSGKGELVLTDLGRKASSLQLPKGFSRALVVDLLRDQIVAELSERSNVLLALPAGKYALQVWREGVPMTHTTRIAHNEAKKITWNDFRAAEATAHRGKGEQRLLASPVAFSQVQATTQTANTYWHLRLGAGLAGGYSDAQRRLSALQIGLGRGETGFSGQVEYGRSYNSLQDDTLTLLAARYSVGIRQGSLWALMMTDVGIGLAIQSQGGESRGSGVLALRPRLAMRWSKPANTIFVEVAAGVSVLALQRDGQLDAIASPIMDLSIGWFLK